MHRDVYLRIGNFTRLKPSLHLVEEHFPYALFLVALDDGQVGYVAVELLRNDRRVL